jgi:hypothetical protein
MPSPGASVACHDGSKAERARWEGEHRVVALLSVCLLLEAGTSVGERKHAPLHERWNGRLARRGRSPSLASEKPGIALALFWLPK